MCTCTEMAMQGVYYCSITVHDWGNTGLCHAGDARPQRASYCPACARLRVSDSSNLNAARSYMYYCKLVSLLNARQTTCNLLQVSHDIRSPRKTRNRSMERSQFWTCRCSSPNQIQSTHVMKLIIYGPSPRLIHRSTIAFPPYTITVIARAVLCGFWLRSPPYFRLPRVFKVAHARSDLAAYAIYTLQLCRLKHYAVGATHSKFASN